MRKIRIAQIGTNFNSHGPDVFATLKNLPDLFEIVGYTFVEDEDSLPENRKAVFRGYPRLTTDEILSDPTIEAVAVETDEIHLTKYAKMAVEAGKHIHMEKPGSPSLSDFCELIELVKRSKKTFHLGYMYRYNSYVKNALERVKAGELGNIYSVEAQMNCIHPKQNREWLSLFPGGMTFYLGCHLVDLIISIQGEPERIIPLNKSTGRDGVSATDLGFAVFEYKNGVSFLKTSASESGGFMRRRLFVGGEKGTIELSPLERYVDNGLLVTDRVEALGDISWNDKGNASTSEPQNRYTAMMEAFAKMVRGEIENPYTPDYELSVFRATLAACGVEF